MGKIIRPILKIASVAVAFIPGVGPLVKLGITIGLSLLDRALAPKSPGVSAAQRDRLLTSLDPLTPRKMVLGITAAATDLRYEEWSGTGQEYNDRIICCAAHKLTSIDEIWLNDVMAWSAAGGVTAAYAGYLWITPRTEGTAANTIPINGGAKWGASRRLTGCAYFHMRCKLTGNSKTAESPFSSGIPDRMTVRVHGMPLYDPRLDSSVGGSGSVRADDCATWTWSSDTAGQNPILQALSFELGWRINGEVSVGPGLPPRRLDLAGAMAPATLCEEAVTLAAGGSEPRYRSAGVISDADQPLAVLESLMASCAGTVRDAGGKLAFWVRYNDLAAPVAAFSDDDIIGAFEWAPVLGLDEDFNIVRGRYSDPSDNALYQLVDYPQVSLASPDGLPRSHALDLDRVQSASQAQRLAKMELQRHQFQGTFSATFKATALAVVVGNPVTITFSPRGWVNKLFRVQQQLIRMDGTVDMTLREEGTAIYSWLNEEVAAVTAITPTPYDPINSPLVRAIVPATMVNAVAPADAQPGQLWIDPATGNPYRFGGRELTFAGQPLTFAAQQVMTTGYQSVQDGAIADAQASADAAQADVDALAARIDAIDDDGILSISEKVETLIPAAASLEALWTATSALAATAGVSSSAAATQRTAWLAYLAAITPAWNSISDASTITRGSLDAARSSYDAALKDLQRAATEAMTAARTPRQDVSAPAISLTASAAGVLDGGQLPKGWSVIRWRGSTDVSTSATWSIVAQVGITGAAVTVTNGSVSIPTGAVIAMTASVTVRSIIDGVAMDSVTTITRNDAAAPSSGSGGGTAVSTSTLTSVSGTAFAVISAVLTVHTGSSGALALTAALAANVTESSPAGSFGCELQWRYRTVGGGWTTLSASASTADATVYDEGGGFYTSDAGSVSSAPTVTGLTASTDYEVQLTARRTSSSPAKTIYFSGLATATGS